MLEILLPVAVGAVLAAVGGLIGAWIQRRAEHKRWVRERRYDAYIAMQQVNNQIDSAKAQQAHLARQAQLTDNARMKQMLADDMVTLRAKLDTLLGQSVDVASTVEILGPTSIVEANSEYLKNPDEQRRDVLLKAMRAVLKISAER